MIIKVRSFDVFSSSLFSLIYVMSAGKRGLRRGIALTIVLSLCFVFEFV